MQSLSAFLLFFEVSSSDLPSYGSELRKRYTLRLLLMFLKEGSFGSCSTSEDGGQMTHLGGRFAWGGLGVGGNYAS